MALVAHVGSGRHVDLHVYIYARASLELILLSVCICAVSDVRRGGEFTINCSPCNSVVKLVSV